MIHTTGKASATRELGALFSFLDKVFPVSRLFAGTPFDRPPVCDRCGKLESDCACPPIVPEKELTAPSLQTATLRTEKRAKGKLMTVIRGLAAEKNDLPALLTKLKSQCGAGGTLDGDLIEIQGDHVERLRSILTAIGYRVK